MIVLAPALGKGVAEILAHCLRRESLREPPLLLLTGSLLYFFSTAISNEANLSVLLFHIFVYGRPPWWGFYFDPFGGQQQRIHALPLPRPVGRRKPGLLRPDVAAT